MSRASDAFVDKNEPTFQTDTELEKIEIVLALNWYSQNRMKEHSHKYLKQYCKQHDINVTDAQVSHQVATFGFVSRLLMHGAILDERSMQWFHRKLQQMREFVPPPVMSKPKPKPVVDKKDNPKEEGVAPKEKKPRKKKFVAPEAQVKHVKYLEQDGDIKSIDPIKIIGATTLWTYHVPSRTLSQYIAKTDSGLMMNRCSIENYSEEKSTAKKLRKPELILPKVTSLSSGALKGLLNELTTKQSNPTGRINSQTIIMRVTI